MLGGVLSLGGFYNLTPPLKSSHSTKNTMKGGDWIFSKDLLFLLIFLLGNCKKSLEKIYFWTWSFEDKNYFKALICIIPCSVRFWGFSLPFLSTIGVPSSPKKNQLEVHLFEMVNYFNTKFHVWLKMNTKNLIIVFLAKIWITYNGHQKHLLWPTFVNKNVR